MAALAWREIQALRAEPTGEAARDENRKKTFRSALRQAEELAEAADVVSYAAKPIPLFYALSQAGRAIAAACTPDPWVLRGHGLKCEPGANLLDATVEPNHTRAAFQKVTAAANSSILAGKTQIGALWAANPDLIGVPIRLEFGLGQWPAALGCGLGAREVGTIGPPTIDPLATMQTTTGGRVRTTLNIPGDTGEQIARALETYPSLAGAAALTPSDDRYVGPAEPVERILAPDGQQGVRIGKDDREQSQCQNIGSLRTRCIPSLRSTPDSRRCHQASLATQFRVLQAGRRRCHCCCGGRYCLGCPASLAMNPITGLLQLIWIARRWRPHCAQCLTSRLSACRPGSWRA